MEALVLALKAFAVACGIVTGVILAPLVALGLFIGGFILIYMLAWCGDQIQDWWRRTWR